MEPRLTLTEGDPAQRIALSDSEHTALQRLGIAAVVPTTMPGVYELSASRKVGVVSLGDRELLVRPKIQDLNRLTFLAGYALKPDIWRDDPVRLDPAEELLPALAEAFSRMATRAAEQGLLMGYRTVSDDIPVLRGRLLTGIQMSRWYGMPLPLAVEYDEFSSDIAENRVLLLATTRLLTLPCLSEPARRRLHRLRMAFAEVTLLPRGAVVPAWQPSRLNVRFHDALRLAELVLAAESFEHRFGSLTVTGYMFDMWKIYEDFVCTALSESLAPYGGHCALQHRMPMDDAAEITTCPDLVWFRSGRNPRAIVDAKYKAESPAGFPDADLYQMLAYCTVTGLDHGHLVYAKGNAPNRVHRIRGSSVTIHCHALDLSLPPLDLLAAVDDLAARIAAPSYATATPAQET
ncbi:restriction endonuclease [Nocardia otitidiscaviarum]|uniref:Restriction endonuclease n=1 Tax=Nocardia otitidiscaviarum TaxID=1823 RepID=A0A516NHR6_9NOCA|nr:restriction endonuclease [Nocardia otitidiscaviarum]MCP9620032.1 McrC family protein [Nocardia otitidiscaviarum]QDP78451.1 restriction endonuclease [Nocardia otitidiscaviarum]